MIGHQMNGYLENFKGRMNGEESSSDEGEDDEE